MDYFSFKSTTCGRKCTNTCTIGLPLQSLLVDVGNADQGRLLCHGLRCCLGHLGLPSLPCALALTCCTRRADISANSL